MNKIVGVPVVGSRKPKRPKPTGGKPIADLREWLSRVDAIGELVRVASRWTATRR